VDENIEKKILETPWQTIKLEFIMKKNKLTHTNVDVDWCIPPMIFQRFEALKIAT
jgi:hypothetical protein